MAVKWEMITDTCEIHRARKDYLCELCSRAIPKGWIYVEDRFDVSPYAGGRRYHFDCAREKKLVLLMVGKGMSLADRPEPAERPGRKIRRVP